MLTSIKKYFFSLFLAKKNNIRSYPGIKIVVLKDRGIILGCFVTKQVGNEYQIVHQKTGVALFKGKSEKELNKIVNKWTKEAKKAGKSLATYIDELVDIENDIINRIIKGRFTKKTLKSNIDLLDEAGNTLFRLAKEDYESFINFAKKTSKERKKDY